MESNFTKAAERMPIVERLNVVLSSIQNQEKEFNFDYWTSILKGNDLYLKNRDHKFLPYFGAMHEFSQLEISGTINYLIKNEFVIVSNPSIGILQVSTKGEEFIAGKLKMYQVKEQELKLKRGDFTLMKALKEERKLLAKEFKVQLHKICSNFIINQLAWLKPTTRAEITEIEGTEKYEVEYYWDRLLKVINNFIETKNERYLPENLSKLETYQETKRLFLEGMSVSEIAIAKSIQENTVFNYLITLHEAKEIDFIPYIQKTIPAKILDKGVVYFKTMTEKRLKIAHELLKLDYDVLKMCRLVAMSNAA